MTHIKAFEKHAKAMVHAENTGNPVTFDSAALMLAHLLDRIEPERGFLLMAYQMGSLHLLDLMLRHHSAQDYARIHQDQKLNRQFAFSLLISDQNLPVLNRLKDVDILSAQDGEAILVNAIQDDSPELLNLARRLVGNDKTMASFTMATMLVEPCGPRLASTVAEDLRATPLHVILRPLNRIAHLPPRTARAISLAHPEEPIDIPTLRLQCPEAVEIVTRSQSAHGRMLNMDHHRSLEEHLAFGPCSWAPS